MNLERHLRVLWRRRILVASGFVLACILAFLTAFSVTADGPKRRGTEVWSSSSQILVTQQGFPWGRVTLPDSSKVTGAQATTTPDTARGDKIRYADPTRFVNLALLYSVISHSDDVRARLRGHPAADQIQTTLLDPTNSGNSYLPIIQLTTKASTAAEALSLNTQTYDGLRGLLTAEQDSNGITGTNRVLLSVLNRPSAPVIVEGRSLTSAMLAFIMAIIATIAFAHIAEAVAMARARRATPEPSPGWDVPDGAGDGDGGEPLPEQADQRPEPDDQLPDEDAVTAVDGRPGLHRGDPLVVASSRSSQPS
jgi:hypothetical protein